MCHVLGSHLARRSDPATHAQQRLKYYEFWASKAVALNSQMQSAGRSAALVAFDRNRQHFSLLIYQFTKGSTVEKVVHGAAHERGAVAYLGVDVSTLALTLAGNVGSICELRLRPEEAADFSLALFNRVVSAVSGGGRAVGTGTSGGLRERQWAAAIEMGTQMERASRCAEALAVLQEMIESIRLDRRKVGTGSAQATELNEVYGQLLYSTACLRLALVNVEDAQELLEECVDVSISTLGKRDPHTLRRTGLLGSVLVQAGAFTEAKALLEGLLVDCKDVGSSAAEEVDIAAVLHALGDACVALKGIL